MCVCVSIYICVCIYIYIYIYIYMWEIGYANVFDQVLRCQPLLTGLKI